ncbi:UvrD-helicase domain-containing protein [Ketobacter sp.]|uniref:UvrD-helicase domain-containing protein n=1 Tax=Ketobacter sp. TaxID=2083498 RepID=UPI000F1575FD|nr:UvrD-helicase domain-containing protein [Ketobacter sp.]RLT95094.1 MAG: DNA helicase II [Ketobacter sp.]
MTTQRRPSDREQRQLALDPEQSFICEAPAGSGKTELLTQRFLNLLTRVERPEQVLAITFTRKAVGEMRERILSALQSATGPQPGESHKQQTWQLASAVLQRDRQRQWSLLDNPNRLQIKTFDSLCAFLTNSMPLESAIGSKPQISDDSEVIYRRAVQALLATLESAEPWSEALATLLQQMDNRFARLEALLMQMLTRREEWLPLLGYSFGQQPDPQAVRASLEHNLGSIIRDSVAKMHELIPPPLQRELLALAGFAAANLKRMQLDSPILHCLDLDLDHAQQSLPGWTEADLPRWQGIITLLTTAKGEWRKTVNKNTGFPPGDNAQEKRECKARKEQLLELIGQLQAVEGLDDAVADMLVLPQPHFSAEQWCLLDALTQVLPVLAAQLLLVFQETNSLDFAEISIRARRALGALDDPSQLALKMDYRLQHILVDEFQDTSASQVQLLNQLTAGWQPGDGRTLFCVGDAMQSIYGFRGANVGLFLNCREQGLENVPLTPLRLTTNFRSQAGVVEWVNRVFQRAFPTANDISTGAVTYSPSDAFHPQRDERSVWVHGFVESENHDSRAEEARVILELIQTCRSRQPEASIAILVRNRPHAAHILPLLKAAGISYRALDLELLQDQPVIQDLMALTRALLHPADRTAWLAVLRAPWCGLSLVDLEAIANLQRPEQRDYDTLFVQLEQAMSAGSASHSQAQNGDAAPLQNDFFFAPRSQQGQPAGQLLSADGRTRLARVLPILQQAVLNVERKTLRSWIEGTWLALGGAACVTDAEALKNADKFFGLLSGWSHGSAIPSLDSLQKAVEKLYAAPDPNADDRLQIMTIHKSKGLEFDVVIVPALHKAPRSDDPALLLWHERLNSRGEMELVMAPITAVGRDKHPTYRHLQMEDSKKSRYESCRLLYVACTRAKQALHLTAQVKADEARAPELKPPAKSSLLYSIWEPVQLQVQRYDSTVPAVMARTGFAPRPLQRLPRHWQPPPLPAGHLLEPFVPRYEYGDASNRVELSWQDATPRAVGTLVHRYLQHIGNSGIQRWRVDGIRALEPAMAVALSGLGVPRPRLSAAVDKVSLALQMVLQDSRAEHFLSHKHPFHASEYPITFASSVGPKNLQIDRVFTTSQGTTWLVDYKTSEPEAGQSLDSFIAQELEQYQAQLSLYQRALQAAGFSKVKKALYFPLITHWQEVG